MPDIPERFLCTFGYSIFIVCLWYIYPIFIVYLSYVVGEERVESFYFSLGVTAGSRTLYVKLTLK